MEDKLRVLFFKKFLSVVSPTDGPGGDSCFSGCLQVTDLIANVNEFRTFEALAFRDLPKGFAFAKEFRVADDETEEMFKIVFFQAIANVRLRVRRQNPEPKTSLHEVGQNFLKAIEQSNSLKFAMHLSLEGTNHSREPPETDSLIAEKLFCRKVPGRLNILDRPKPKAGGQSVEYFHRQFACVREGAVKIPNQQCVW